VDLLLALTGREAGLFKTVLPLLSAAEHLFVPPIDEIVTRRS